MVKKILLFLCAVVLTAFADGPKMVWNFKDGLQGWRTANLEDVTVNENGLSGNAKTDVQFTSPKLGIQAGDYDTLTVAMKCSVSGGGEIFIKAAGENFKEKKFRHITMKASEKISVYSFCLSAIPGWEGEIEAIRFDPINPAAQLTIQSIALSKTGAKADRMKTEADALPLKNGVLSWNFSRGLQGWRPERWAEYKIDAQGFSGVSKYDCGLTSPPLGIKAEDFDTLAVIMKADSNENGEIFVASNGDKLSDKHMLKYHVRDTEKHELYTIATHNIPGWNGTIDYLRFDPLNSPDRHISIASIKLFKCGNNMLFNGDFELSDAETPIGWRLTGAKLADGAFSGNSCLQLKAGDMAENDFPNVARLGTFSVSFRNRGAQLKGEVEFFGGDGRSIGTVSLLTKASEDWREQAIQSLAVPEMAYRGIIRFTGLGESKLDAVVVRRLTEGSPMATKERQRPRWRGKWIWCEGNKDKDHCTAYVRKTFRLPEGKLKAADIQLTCDDSFALYINGEFVHKTHDVDNAWKTPVLLDVRKYLKPGENTFLAEVVDLASQQGFIADFVAFTEDGQSIVVATDETWEGAEKQDGPWSPAAVIGVPPCAPWFEANYTIMRCPLVVNGKIRVSLAGVPGKVKAGQRLPLQLDIQSAPFTGAVPVRAVVIQNGKEVCEEWSLDGLVYDQGKPSLTLSAYFPRRLATGTCTLKVEFYGAEPEKEITAELQVEGHTAREYEFPKAEFVVNNGVTTLMINGKIVDPTQALFCRPVERHSMLARDAGIHLWGVEDGGMGFYEHGFDYTAFDNAMEAYLAVDPDAWFIINYSLNTQRQPWWMLKHPEVHCRYEDGSNIINDYRTSKGMRPAYASQVWRETYADVLRRFIRHIRTTPYAEHVVGFHSINGISAEWFHWGSQSMHFVDYSEASQVSFRNWLKGKYGTEAALQAAWKRQDVTFANASVPSGKERQTTENGLYFNPVTQMNVLDYNDYLNDNCIETINYFNRIVKEETGGRAICGTYYGYVVNINDTAFFGPNSGHFRLGTMLKSPEFDYAIAPDTYGYRQVGGTSGTMTAPGSFVPNGKFFWNQADLRSHWVFQRIVDGFIETVQQSVDCMERDFARCLSEGTGIQWYDFSKGWTLGDKRLMAEARKLYDLSCRYRNSVKDWREEDYLLVVLDERLMGRWNPMSNIGGGSLHIGQEECLWRAGMPWKIVLFSELMAHKELLKHKAMLFTDAYRLTDEYKAFLAQNVLKDGRLVAFVGCPGMLTRDGLSAEYLSKLMGCPFKVDDGPAVLRSSGTSVWNDLEGKSWGHRETYKSTQFLMPEGTDGCEIIGRLEDGRPSALFRDNGRCRVFWSAAPGLSPEVLRALADRAGLPVIARDNDGLYAGHGFMGIYASKDGEKELKFIGEGSPRDILTGQTWPKGTKTVKVHMRTGETRIFIME